METNPISIRLNESPRSKKEESSLFTKGTIQSILDIGVACLSIGGILYYLFSEGRKIEEECRKFHIEESPSPLSQILYRECLSGRHRVY